MKRDYLKYIASLLLFGSNGIMAAGIDAPSGQVVLMRTLLGALTLVTVLAATRTKLQIHRSPRDLAYVVASGVAMGVCWVFVYMAYREIGVGITSLLYAMGPVLVMAFSPALFGERMTLPTMGCFAVVLTGAVMTNGPVADSALGTVGIMHGAIAALAYAAMIVLCKKAHVTSGLECSAVQLVAATVTAIAALGVQGLQLAPVPMASIAPAFMLGVVNTGLGCYLYFSSIGNLPAQTVATCDYVEPLSAVVLSAVVLGESMQPMQWLGAALIVVGAVSCEVVRTMRRSRVQEQVPA